jgi:branched-chain amino acid transport system substrate-binding protein
MGKRNKHVPAQLKEETKMKKNIFTLIGLLVVVALFLAACASPTPAPAPTQPPAAVNPTTAPVAAQPTVAPAAATDVFKLGVDGPFSGPSALTGNEFKASVTMAMEKINYTIGKYKIQPVWIDDQSDPAKGTQAYQQAIDQDHIQAGILNWNSSVAVALMDVVAKAKIPHFFGFGATELVNEKFASDPAKYGYWMIKGWPEPAKLSTLYVQALNDAVATGTWKPAAKTVAIYGEDTDWGRSFGGALKTQFTQSGWTIVDEEYFAIDQTEFTPLLTKIKGLNPAVLAGTSTAPPSLSAFIKQADDVGVKSLIVADGLGWVGDWYKLTGKSSDYVIDQIPGWATDAGKQFAADFKTKNGFDPSPSAAGLAYDGTNFFIAMANEVYKQTGTLTSDSIYNFVKDNIWTGKWTYKGGIVMNEYKYMPDTIPDPVVGKGEYIFPVLQYSKGVGQIIYPPEWAVQKLTPKP